MFIKEILSQHRRDFLALYKCEHCGEEEPYGGYDDSNFHNNVVPTMICESCGKHQEDRLTPLQPRYPAGYVI